MSLTARLLDLGAAATYRLVACRLPMSSSPGGQIWCSARRRVARRMLASQGSKTNIEKGALFSRRRLVALGDRSGIGIDCRLYGPVTIGSDVMMGPEVVIYASSHDFSEVDRPMIQQGFVEDRPVTIEDNVWIGTRAVILPGVTIGQGSVIGACAVVTRDIPPFSVVVGNPGRVVKSRLEQSTIGEIVARKSSVDTARRRVPPGVDRQ